MKITKKIISAVLIVGMLVSTQTVPSMASLDNTNDAARDNTYTKAQEDVDAQYTYAGTDLGITYEGKNETSSGSTTFKVWAPAATSVFVNLYNTGSDDEEGARTIGKYTLEKMMVNGEWNGLWTLTLVGECKNYYYTYTITTTTPYHIGSDDTVTNEVPDIYGKASGVNGKRSKIINLDDTDPEGWAADQHVYTDGAARAYELHIKDFSYDPQSGISAANRGKYLAFTETGTTLNGEGKISTGIDHLKSLGITTVMLNPFYDFASVDETGDSGQYSMGYDAWSFFTPEGSYSSNPYDGNTKIKECKQMIKALHDAGISVVMDVSYSNTASIDDVFEKTVPEYYHRMKTDGSFSDASGYGNECASERAMWRNYVLQSLRYWVDEYHVDGFNFELMGLMDVEMMNLIRTEMNKVSDKIAIWGEPWADGTCYHPTNTCKETKWYPSSLSNAKRLNDGILLFNPNNQQALMDFVLGDASKSDTVCDALKSSREVNYVSWHEGQTLYDTITSSKGLGSYGTRNDAVIAANKMAATMTNMSKGVTVMLAGEEMCRSNGGVTNGSSATAETQCIKWKNLVDYTDVVSYYRGLLQIKNEFNPLSDLSGSDSDDIKVSEGKPAGSDIISYTIRNNSQTGKWNTMLVISNQSGSAKTVTLPADSNVENWVVIADGYNAQFKSLQELSGNQVLVAEHTTLVAVDKPGFQSAGVQSEYGKVNVNYYLTTSKDSIVRKPMILQGEVGKGYTIPETLMKVTGYTLESTEGATEGFYTKADQTVSLYYKSIFNGLEDQKTYCGSTKFSIDSTWNVDTVTVNGTEIQPDANGDYTLTPSEDEQLVRAVSKSNEIVVVSVKVNDGHTAEADDEDCTTPVLCKECGEVIVPAKTHDFSGAWQTDGTDHWKQCQNAGCKAEGAKAAHSGTDDGDCTTPVVCKDCGKEITAGKTHVFGENWQKDKNYHWHACENQGCAVTDSKAAHSGIDDGNCKTAVICKCGYIITPAKADHTYGAWTSNGDGTHTRRCTVAGCKASETKECSGGTATCTKQAKCKDCGALYGQKDAKKHSGKAEWTKTKNSHVKKYTCCGAVAVAKEDHEWKNGVCSECGYICKHTGGTATCSERATCEICGSKYGKKDTGNHADLEHIKAKAATTKAAGNIEYWHCEDCDKYYSDKAATAPITQEDTVVAKKTNTAPDTEKKDDTTKQDQQSQQTPATGTTQESGKTDTTATQQTGKADGKQEPAEKKPVKTGDTSGLVLWMIVFAVSGGTLTGHAVLNKKRKRHMR